MFDTKWNDQAVGADSGLLEGSQWRKPLKTCSEAVIAALRARFQLVLGRFFGHIGGGFQERLLPVRSAASWLIAVLRYPPALRPVNRLGNLRTGSVDGAGTCRFPQNCFLVPGGLSGAGGFLGNGK